MFFQKFDLPVLLHPSGKIFFPHLFGIPTFMLRWSKTWFLLALIIHTNLLLSLPLRLSVWLWFCYLRNCWDGLSSCSISNLAYIIPIYSILTRSDLLMYVKEWMGTTELHASAYCFSKIIYDWWPRQIFDRNRSSIGNIIA